MSLSPTLPCSMNSREHLSPAESDGESNSNIAGSCSCSETHICRLFMVYKVVVVSVALLYMHGKDYRISTVLTT